MEPTLEYLASDTEKLMKALIAEPSDAEFAKEIKYGGQRFVIKVKMLAEREDAE